MIEKVEFGGNTLIDITTREWHQCPQAVRNYLDNVTYDPSDYTVSSIATYAPASAVSSNTKPIGNTVVGVTHYNEIPKVATPIVSGAVKPLDRLRWINSVTGNFRDLGGWNCDGGTVKYGLLFRGAECSVLDTDLAVNQLGIRHELQLRGLTDIPQAYSLWGIDWVCAPDYNWYEITNHPESWKINLRCIFDAVVNKEPVFFHCAGGADRTGTMACILEGLLGVSQSDCDKDYELTCFYTGTADDTAARRRNEGEWKGLINQINAKTGNSFRDKIVNFVAELGFTAAEINAFRAAMIDGTPATVTPTIGTATITNTLTNVSSDNVKVSESYYQPYEAELTPASGKVIDSITVTMGGVDVTASYFKGVKTNLKRAVEGTYNHCTTDNDRQTVIDGQSFGATLTAVGGYTMEGGTVSITMGGVDVSNYYSGGKIAIPRVTGNIVITATAIQSEEDNFIKFNELKCYVGMSSSGSQSAASHYEIDSANKILKILDVYRAVQGIYTWGSPTLAALPAGTYKFSGEFKQDTSGVSALAIYANGTRLFKNSLAVGNTYTPFEYEFTISAASDVTFETQNDYAASGIAYVKNPKIIAV